MVFLVFWEADFICKKVDIKKFYNVFLKILDGGKKTHLPTEVIFNPISIFHNLLISEEKYSWNITEISVKWLIVEDLRKVFAQGLNKFQKLLLIHHLGHQTELVAGNVMKDITELWSIQGF